MATGTEHGRPRRRALAAVLGALLILLGAVLPHGISAATAAHGGAGITSGEAVPCHKTADDEPTAGTEARTDVTPVCCTMGCATLATVPTAPTTVVSLRWQTIHPPAQPARTGLTPEPQERPPRARG